MNPLSLIPAPYRLVAQAIAVALVVAAAVAWWHSHNYAQQKIGYDKANAEWNAWKAAADAKANAENLERQKQKETAQNEAAKRQMDLENIASALRSDRDRLRNDNAAMHTRISVLTVDAARRVADTAAAIFSECEDKYSAVAIAADQCLSERQTLIDAWPR